MIENMESILESHYGSLRQYFQNGCILHPGFPPVIGEAGYGDFISKKIESLKIKPGDTIRITEERYDKGKCTYSGIILDICKTHRSYLELLLQGKKVWKDFSNKKCVMIDCIIEIEKLADASPDFNIEKANPYDIKYMSSPIDVLEIRKERAKSYLQKITSIFHTFNKQTDKLLYLHFDFCWSIPLGTVKSAVVSITTKDGSAVTLPDYKIAHCYPNKDYYTLCEVNRNIKDYALRGLTLHFNSMKSLSQIQLVSVLWTVELPGGIANYLTLIYPNFIEGDGFVYNLTSCSTDMDNYEEALHIRSVFSNRMQRDFDKAFVYASNFKRDCIFDIMNADDAVKYILDVSRLLNIQKRVGNIIPFKREFNVTLAEVLVKHAKMMPGNYVE